MLNLLSRIARKVGLMAVHVTVVRESHGAIRVMESNFSCEPTINVCQSLPAKKELLIDSRSTSIFPFHTTALVLA